MCKHCKPSGQYILYVTMTTPTGEKMTRHYNRLTKFWSMHQGACTGYKCCAVARGQLTQLERKGFNLPKGYTVHEWGHQWSPC